MVLFNHVSQYIVRCIVRQYYFVTLAPNVPQRLKINDLITRDSREFPAPDPLVIPGYKPDSRRSETGSIPVKSRTARKLKSPTPPKGSGLPTMLGAHASVPRNLSPLQRARRVP